MRFDRVLFFDDFLRTRSNGLASFPGNRRMLRGLFEPALRRLELDFAEVFSADDGGSLVTAEVMASLGLPRTPEGWARATSLELPALGAGAPQLGPSTLVIGFGLTPAQLRFFHRSGCAFLDLEVHPWRFEPELAFRVRTNDPALREHLASLALSEETAWNAAARLRASFAFRRPGVVVDERLRVGLFVGQTRVDLSLVQEGKVRAPADVVEEVTRLSREVDLLLLKPHPYEGSRAHLLPLYRAAPNARFTTDNVYALLCCDNLKFVAGLSSGTLAEATFFHRPTHQLAFPDRDERRFLPQPCSDWIRVSADLAAFGSVARMVGAPGSGGRPQSLPADTLSRAVGVRWGADDLETPLSVPTPVIPGQFSFAAGGGGAPLLGTGWSHPEDEGVWSEGGSAQVRFALEPSLRPSEELELTFAVSLLRLGSSHLARVWLRQPGHAPRAVNAALETEELIVRFAGASLPLGRLVEVMFEIENPTAPAEIAPSTDRRRLGLRLRSLRLRVLNKSSR